MITAQTMQDTQPGSIWGLLPFFATGAFLCCLGLAFVSDYRGFSSGIATRTRDEDAQRVINKILGWFFVISGAVFLYGATTVLIELATG